MCASCGTPVTETGEPIGYADEQRSVSPPQPPEPPPQPPPQPPAQPPVEGVAGGYAPAAGATGIDAQQNVLSIIGLVFGVLGLIGCLIFGFVGLVLGGVAYSRKEPLAIWALGVSAVAVVLRLAFGFLSSVSPFL